MTRNHGILRVALPILALLGGTGCPPTLGDDDDSTSDDDDATSDDDDATGDDDDSTTSAVRELMLCDAGGKSRIWVDAAQINGAFLTMDVSYGGGCEVHDVQLCWDGSFMESWPVQVVLTPIDNGPPDPCDGILYEQLIVDLSLLQRAWEDSYGPPPGTIAINLEGQSLTWQF